MMNYEGLKNISRIKFLLVSLKISEKFPPQNIKMFSDINFCPRVDGLVVNVMIIWNSISAKDQTFVDISYIYQVFAQLDTLARSSCKACS